jgi:5-methylthioadenosine/S-adenosylhomocysteine deaminase
VQSVDLIVTNIDRLITVDPGRRIIRDEAIAANGGKFVSLDKSAAIAKANSAGRTVDAGGTMATPSFVDCHLHSSFHLSRGLADEAYAQSLLFDWMCHYEAALDGDDVHLSATLAAAELLKRG